MIHFRIYLNVFTALKLKFQLNWLFDLWWIQRRMQFVHSIVVRSVDDALFDT